MKKESTRKINVLPLGDRVLIKALSEEEKGRKLPSGIIIPDTVDKEKPEQGKVIAVGPGRKTDNGATVPMDVKVGDTVIFSKYGYDEVKINDEEYLIVSESNILAIVTSRAS